VIVRHLHTVGGLAIVACACWLPFSDKASARLAVTSATPFITGASLKRVAEGKPQLGFRLHQGLNGSEITKFTIGFPRGLSLNPYPRPPLVERWNGHQWECTREGKSTLACATNTPVMLVKTHVGQPLLVESNALETRVKHHHHHHPRLVFHMTCTDTTGNQWAIPVVIKAF
jgi:hypothetical protein